MIRFQCPKCEKKLGVPDDQAGGVGVCPACKSKFRIPQIEPDEEEEEEAPPVRKPAAKSRGEGVTALPPSKRKPPVQDEDEEEEEEQPPPRKRKPVEDEDEEEEEEERPARKRKPVSRHDDDEDEDEEEEEERRPRKKKKRKKKRRSSGAGISLGDNWYLMAAGGVVAVSLIACVAGIFIPPLLILPVILGWGVAIVGSIWFLIVAFQDDVMQGILCLFVPCYSLFYLISNFEEEKIPFFTYMLGFAIMIAASVAGGAAAGMNAR